MINMDEIESRILILIFLGLAMSIIFALLILLFKIDWKNTTVISFIFALFFSIAYFFQPFLVTIDYLFFLYESSKLRERNYERIDKAFTLVYKIVGYVGTCFSLILLPIFKNFYFSGYFKFHQKLGDSIKRFFRDDLFKYYIIAIPVSIILIVGIIFYFIRKEIVLNTKDLVLNCLIIPGIFKCLLYIGCYLPILLSELNFAIDCICKSKEKYNNILKGVILKYLDKDKYNLKKAFVEIIKNKTKININLTQEQKAQIENTIKKCEECKDESKQDIIKKNEIINEEIEKLPLIFEKAIYNLFCDSLTKINEVLLTIPRKTYVYENIQKKFEKEYRVIFVLLWALMILIGIFVFGIEIFGNFFNYSESRNEYNKITISKCMRLFFYLLSYHMVVFFSVLKRNSITNQMLYGRKNSDTLCLLNFATEISGLITPVSFIVIYSKVFGIYDYDEPFEKITNNNFYPHNNMIFTRTYKYIIIENIKPLFNLDITFKKTFYIYVAIKSCILILFFFGTFCFHSLTIKLGCCCPKKKCCKKKCDDIKFTYIFNDKNEKSCSKCRHQTFENIGKTGDIDRKKKEPELIEMILNNE